MRILIWPWQDQIVVQTCTVSQRVLIRLWVLWYFLLSVVIVWTQLYYIASLHTSRDAAFSYRPVMQQNFFATQGKGEEIFSPKIRIRAWFIGATKRRRSADQTRFHEQTRPALQGNTYEIPIQNLPKMPLEITCGICLRNMEKDRHFSGPKRGR